MTETMDDERDARMTLAALSEPGDIVTGTLVARFGATVVVEAGHRSGPARRSRFRPGNERCKRGMPSSDPRGHLESGHRRARCDGPVGLHGWLLRRPHVRVLPHETVQPDRPGPPVLTDHRRTEAAFMSTPRPQGPFGDDSRMR